MNFDDDMVVCPYNKLHIISRYRMPRHLLKCVNNYNGEKLESCPYNSMHKIPGSLLKEHFNTCYEYLVNENREVPNGSKQPQ